MTSVKIACSHPRTQQEHVYGERTKPCWDSAGGLSRAGAKGTNLYLHCVVGSHRVLCLKNVSVNILQSGDTGERKPYGPAIIYTQYSLTIELAHVYY